MRKSKVLNDTNRELEELMRITDTADLKADSIVAYSEPLTWRQKAFVNQYCIDFNAVRAFIRAFPQYSDTLESTVKTYAHNMLNKPNVQEAVLMRTIAMQNAAQIKKEWVLTELLTLYEQVCAMPGANPQVRAKLQILKAITELQGFNILEQLAKNTQLGLPVQINVNVVRDRSEIQDVDSIEITE